MGVLKSVLCAETEPVFNYDSPAIICSYFHQKSQQEQVDRTFKIQMK